MATRVVNFILLAAAFFAVGTTTQAEFIPVAGFDQQLFPSYLIATASIRTDKSAVETHRLGDSSGLLGIDIVSPGADVEIKVTVECDDYFQPSVYSGTLAESGAKYRITPKIKYRYDRLAHCEQAAPISVTFRVQIGDDAEEEQIVTCTMRSINDCPFAFRKGDEVVDTSFAFAAYVNEQHPFVDKLLREALDRGVVQSFQGYQAGTPEDVIRQAYAVWDLLVARDIRYSSITTTAVDSDSVSCQHVRLIEDSINNSQANCVDGSVLWVSLLRKIGIQGVLVMTSDHCYAGFFLDRKREAFFAIETTLLGEELDEDDVEILDLIDNAIPEEVRVAGSYLSFAAAIDQGTKAFLTSANQEEPADVSEFQIIDIAKVRKQGVLPIAFQNKEAFVGYDFRASGDDAKATDSDETEMDEKSESADTDEDDDEDDATEK